MDGQAGWRILPGQGLSSTYRRRSGGHDLADHFAISHVSLRFDLRKAYTSYTIVWMAGTAVFRGVQGIVSAREGT